MAKVWGQPLFLVDQGLDSQKYMRSLDWVNFELEDPNEILTLWRYIDIFGKDRVEARSHLYLEIVSDSCLAVYDGH